MQLHIGTSGWSYKEWKGEFYPRQVKPGEWLKYYTSVFSCTEINMSFYYMPKLQTVEKWLDMVPADFKFCPKFSRYITHIKRLKDTEQSLERFFDIFQIAKDKLGPVLIQLPPTLKFDAGIAKAFLDMLLDKYGDYSYALEARHSSWICDEAFALLKQHNVAWVISQSGVGFPYSEAITAKHIYLRFHGPGKLFDSSYDQNMLAAYAEKITNWLKDDHDVWAFFNNTMNGHAIQNVLDIQQMISGK